MTTIAASLAERYSSASRRHVVGLPIASASLAWLGSDPDARLDDSARLDLRALGLLDDTDELTTQGAWAREVITRDDLEMIVVRAQRGDETRTLELFHGEGLVFVIDDTRFEGDAEGIHHIGYAALGDVVNLVSRWLPLAPLDASSAERELPLGELVAEAKSGREAVTLVTVAVGASTVLDIVEIAGEGYFFLSVATPGDDADPEAALENLGIAQAVLSPLSAFDIYILLIDAIGLEPDDDTA
jgi:hypothetical protein